MNLVSLRYRSRKAFLRAAKTTTRLLHRTRARLPRGRTVILDILFPGLAAPVLVQAVVAAAGTSTAVIFRPLPSEQKTWIYLREIAAGRSGPRRSHTRYPADLAYECRSEAGHRFRGRLRDLSVGGLAAGSTLCPARSSFLRVTIGPLANGTLHLVYGRVVWARAGEFGVGFTASAGARLRLSLRRGSETGSLRLLRSSV